MRDHGLKMHDLLERLSHWPTSTSLDDRTQVRLVAHQPHRAKLAYLHILYPGLSEWDLAALEGVLSQRLPAALSRFYAATNGIRLFEAQLSVSGLVLDFDRDPAKPQPISIETDNLAFPSLFPVWSRQGYFAIGGLSIERQDKLICGQNDHVILLDGINGEPLREFSDVFDCLTSLADELSSFWTSEGLFVGEWEMLDRLIARRAGLA